MAFWDPHSSRPAGKGRNCHAGSGNTSTDILAHFWREELYACGQPYKEI